MALNEFTAQTLILHNEFMNYRKDLNSKDIWIQYCKENNKTLNKIGLDPEVYETEKKFREFVTYGTMNGSNKGTTNIQELNKEKYELLFAFVNGYFEMDTILFDELNKILNCKGTR